MHIGVYVVYLFHWLCIEYKDPVPTVPLETGNLLSMSVHTHTLQLWQVTYWAILWEHNDIKSHNTRAQRAHTPGVPCTVHITFAVTTWTYAVDNLYLHVRGQSCAWAESTCICIVLVGTVNGCGYDGQLKYTICDICRPCHLILSILKPVFHQLQQICCTYESIRCLDVKI